MGALTAGDRPSPDRLGGGEGCQPVHLVLQNAIEGALDCQGQNDIALQQAAGPQAEVDGRPRCRRTQGAQPSEAGVVEDKALGRAWRLRRQADLDRIGHGSRPGEMVDEESARRHDIGITHRAGKQGEELPPPPTEELVDHTRLVEQTTV